MLEIRHGVGDLGEIRERGGRRTRSWWIRGALLGGCLLVELGDRDEILVDSWCLKSGCILNNWPALVCGTEEGTGEDVNRLKESVLA